MGRMLEPLGRSISFGRLSLKAKVLWPMVLAAADDQGRLLSDPQAIRWAVCPNVDEINVDEISGLLAEMAAQGMVTLYQDGDHGGGACYLQVVKWWEYQHRTSWASPSKYPAPDGWTDHVRCHVKGGKIATSNWPPDALHSGYIAPTQPLPRREGEVECEGEGEAEGEVESSPAAAAFQSYEREIGVLSPTIGQDITDLLDGGVPPFWITEACQEAAKYNRRSWAYARKIVDRWIVQGRSKKPGDGDGQPPGKGAPSTPWGVVGMTKAEYVAEFGEEALDVWADME